MEEEVEVKGISDYIAILKRNVLWIIVPAVLLMIATAVFVYKLPSTYKSEGLILIESQEIPSSLIKSTVTSYADQRIEVIKQRIMTTSRIMDLVKKYNLYPNLKKGTPISEYVSLFRSNIGVQMVSARVTDPTSGRARRANIAFKVYFLDESPKVAQQVANELVTEFLVENTKTRTLKASETKNFLQEEANKFQRKIQETEKKIADFKNQYSNSLPELLQHNLSRVDKLQSELTYNQNQILQLKDMAATMNLELVDIPAYIVTETRVTADGRKIRGPNTQEKLLNAEAEYERLKTKYSPNHPDLKAIIKLIADLEKQLESEAGQPTGKVSGSVNKRTRNPVFSRIKTRIASAEREVLRLEKRNIEIEESLTEYEQRIVQTHQVQRAYDDMTRDHKNQKRKYEELRAKQLEAELGENLESENKAESFSLIEPPLVPNKPEKPNRQKLLAMGAISSLGVGVGLALLVDLLFGGVRGYNEITRILGTAPLVVVPMISTPHELHNKKRVKKRWILLGLILVGLAVAGFHYFVMNLEVLWFKVMRKISLL